MIGDFACRGSAARPEQVEGAAVRVHGEEGLQRAALGVIAVMPLPQPHEHILRHVVGEICVLEDADGHTVNGPAVEVVRLLERPRVALGDLENEPVVV